MDKNKGYLICNNCFGYYKLKENESPDDFKGCECGSTLVYRENIDNLKLNNTNSASKTISSYNETEYDYSVFNEHNDETSDDLSIKSEREQYLEKLQETVLNKDIILKYVNEEQLLDDENDKFPVWDVIEEKEMENEFDNQNIMFNEVMEKENLFQSYIKNKRENEYLRYNYSYLKVGFIILLIAFIILIIIYAMK